MIKDTSGKTCLDLCDEGRGGVNFNQCADMIRNKLQENVVWNRFIVSQFPNVDPIREEPCFASLFKLHHFYRSTIIRVVY